MNKKITDINIKLYNDHFQNYKRYNIPKAQLVIADIPYNTGKNAYASSPEWYKDGDNKKGESKKANAQFFDTDKNFNLAEFMFFCSKMLKKEPKETGKAPCMIVFCAFEQIPMLIDKAKEYGFKHSTHISFIKKSSPQVLKVNWRLSGATEHAMLFYRDKLPKFNNEGKMILDWFLWEKDERPKIHLTQKPIPLLKKLIKIYTDVGDVVIDPVAGSASTLVASAEMNRNAYGFEIKKDFYTKAQEKMLKHTQISLIGY